MDSSLASRGLDCVAGKELWPNSITPDLTNQDCPVLQVGLAAWQECEIQREPEQDL